MTTQLRYIPCATFESAIHAYVDGELAQTDVKNLVVHLETCDGCRDTIEAVRRQVRLHQDAVEIDRAVAGFEKNAFFTKLNAQLVGGNLERLAQLLYELGKAYFLAGNDSRLVAFIHRKAVAIERAHGEGKRLTRETRELATKAGTVARPVAQSIDRAQRLFRSSPTQSRAGRIGVRSGRGALDNARRFLEECLILRPTHVPARLYLGYWFIRVDRPVEAIEEYRKVLAQPGLEPMYRAMALQAIGNAHAYRRDYKKAIRAFEEIVTIEPVARDNRFFTIPLSLAMFHSKLARFDRAFEWFGKLIEAFPTKVREARAVLDQAEEFRALLERDRDFRSELQVRYPVLFAG